jgi:hypothetical protein
MAIHTNKPRSRAAITHRNGGMEQHILSACVLALAALTVLLTLAS